MPLAAAAAAAAAAHARARSFSSQLPALNSWQPRQESSLL